MGTNSGSLAGSGSATVTPASRFSLLAQDLAARARGLWEAYWDYQARRATVLTLEALDDRTLKDIGLSRSQIWPAALGKGGEHPRPYHRHWHKPPAL